MRDASAPPELTRRRVDVPAFRFPEDAARAVALAARHGVWRTAPEGRIPQLGGIRQNEAAAIISQALAEGSGWLSPGR